MSERHKPQDVKVVITAKDGNLYQKVILPNGRNKTGLFQIDGVCEEGEELLDDLARRPNPVYEGTQRGWWDYLNSLLASRGQSFHFPE